ncbi:MAG TPA: acetyl-CoA carboxylase carboxyltransferase subunit alpha [Verrucomicrobiae bacterium]|nr:acetyl-CoA carboxylase carboxyltransferase subunit alpha [Verrucomicrobiae bacterium]
MRIFTLEFEKPILELEQTLDELQKQASEQKIDLTSQIKAIEDKLEATRKEIFTNLTPWQRVQLARHPNRPYMLDYIQRIATDFIELHGDRRFGDDHAIIGGLATIDEHRVTVIGQQKGRDTKENLMRNFGSPHPEGYRKALRLMELAEKFDLPVVSFIDTPGAYPGVGAEERHIAEAIAVNLREMMVLKTPLVAVVIGEGGSGGALGIGVCDRVLILENAYYSVISPEGCAAILWKDRANAGQAAAALKLTAKDLLELGIVDEVIPEPLGGAHKDYDATAAALQRSLVKNLDKLMEEKTTELLEARYKKYRRMGVFAKAEPKKRTPRVKKTVPPASTPAHA